LTEASAVVAGLDAMTGMQPAARDPTLAARYDRQAMDAAVGPKPIDWQAQDWEDLVPRLLLLALSRLQRMCWRGGRRSSPPGAAEAEDFVNDAISKTMAGVRVWDPGACTLFQHLAGIIVSDISHAAESADNRLTASGLESGDGTPIDVLDGSPDQESAALWRSERRRLLAHLDGIDPALRQMAELMLVHDLNETEELRLRLGIPFAEVANRRKRLKRAIRAYLREAAS
jgi:hypothetical protein